MSAPANLPDHDGDEMPAEIDFSNAERGKFFRADAKIRLPLYLEPQVQAYLSECARAKGVAYERLVNELLKKDIELIESAR